MTVADLGEQALVSRIIELLGAHGDGIVCGPGDDAAVVTPASGALVITTDSQLEAVHFRADWIAPHLLGRRAVAINVSDLGAMGAEPRWAVCALSLTASTELVWIEELVRGLRDGGRELGCLVVGGDVARVPGRRGITVTALGTLPENTEPLRRAGAGAGDGCWITGRPGRAGAGRVLLEAGYRMVGANEVELEGTRLEGREEAAAADCLNSFLAPRPPHGLGARLATAGAASALIDLSDGLAIDTLRLSEASRVGIALEIDPLLEDPVLARFEAAGLGRAIDWVLGGGEDYEYLCAVPPTVEERFVALAEEAGVLARRVGAFVVASEGANVTAAGRTTPLVARGWDHFGSAASRGDS